MIFLRIFQHLLPNARAWRITAEKQLRQFFEGLSGLGSDVRTFFDDIYDDLNPQKTRQLDKWENQFGLQARTLTDQERRDRLDGVWKATGGQSPRYIQDTLQNAGFDVYIHEAWEPGTARPGGGAIEGDAQPTYRNPLMYLNDGTGGSGAVSGDGNDSMVDGATEAADGSVSITNYFALVNNIPGDNIIDNTPAEFPYYLYLGGQTFPEPATIPNSRRQEFYTLCLKICPGQQWLGILVDFT